MADNKKYNGSTWEHSLRKLTTATDTFTTLPADIYADGNNATVGISGNMEQLGTPTPDNPIMPQGTGERTGNLIPEYPIQTKTLDGVNWNVSSNGKITGNGTTTSGTNFYLLSNYSIPLKAGTYTLSFIGRKNISLILRNVTTMTTICAIWSTNSSATFTIDNDIPETDRINLYFNTSQAGLSVDIDGYPMLNTGSTALPYEPYGYKIPISSANTTTPVYLGEVETTRKIKKLVFTGDENWYIEGSNIFYTDIMNNVYRKFALICSHFKGVLSLQNNNDITISLSLRINIKTDYVTHNVNDFKTYLAQQYSAGTPVTVWYVLATEQTGIVNEPLMKIGDYADTLSNAAQIPTTEGANSITVDTTVQPSEFSAKWTGWHNSSVKEWDGSDWS